MIEYSKREGYEQAKKRLEQKNGCGIYREEHRYEIDGIRYHKCLCGYRNPSMSFYLDIEDKFSKGILPFKGSYLDQPAKIIDIINRISSLKLDLNDREQKKQQRELELTKTNKKRL